MTLPSLSCSGTLPFSDHTCIYQLIPIFKSNRAVETIQTGANTSLEDTCTVSSVKLLFRPSFARINAAICRQYPAGTRRHPTTPTKQTTFRPLPAPLRPMMPPGQPLTCHRMLPPHHSTQILLLANIYQMCTRRAW